MLLLVKQHDVPASLCNCKTSICIVALIILIFVLFIYSLLTTQVKDSDKNNCNRLKRVATYINVAMNLSLVLRSYYIILVKWWVVNSIEDHLEMMVHTWGVI